jgi:hypothetical protein
MKFHDVGTKRPFDKTGSWDTPTCIEVWRTAPYIHDGHHGDLRGVLDQGDHYGLRRIGVSEQELDDLLEFLKSM